MLTEKQERVLNEIIEFINANKIAPSVRELANLAGLKSTSTVQGYLSRLEKEGYIKRHPTQSRTITVLKGTKTAVMGVSVPVEDLRKIKELINSLPEISVPVEELQKLRLSLNSMDI